MGGSLEPGKRVAIKTKGTKGKLQCSQCPPASAHLQPGRAAEFQREWDAASACWCRRRFWMLIKVQVEKVPVNK